MGCGVVIVGGIIVLFLAGILGVVGVLLVMGLRWLLPVIERSPYKQGIIRGIVVALLTWGVMGAYFVHERSGNASRDKNVSTPIRLLQAVDENNIALVTRELDNGTNPNEASNKPYKGFTLSLPIAVCQQNKAIINLLLEHGADPNLADPYYERQPLAVAASSDDVEIMALLLQHGAKVRDAHGISMALQEAAINGKAVAVKYLLAHGANPAQTWVPNSESIGGEPLYKVVAEIGHPEVARLLRESSKRADLGHGTPKGGE